MARRIAIVGFAESRNDAPWTDDTWEKWCVNDLYAHLQPGWQVHRVFEMHHLLNLNTRRNPNHEKWMKEEAPKFGVPVYMQEHREEFPTSVAYPRQEVLEVFGGDRFGGPAGCDYVTNSISWMVALALLETSTEHELPDGRKVRLCEPGTEIGLWGIQMAGESDEYRFQRPSVEFWLGVCKSMGCRLHIPDDCELLKTLSQYGYDTSSPFRVRCQSMLGSMSEKTIQLQQQEQILLQQIEATRQNLSFLRGAKDAIKQLSGRWTNPLEISVGQELEEKNRTVVQLSDGQNEQTQAEVQAVLQQLAPMIQGGQVG